MIKLAVIELECHAEVLRALYFQLADLEGLTVDIYTSQAIWEEMELVETTQTIRFKLKITSQRVSDFLQENAAELNDHDYLLFNTLQEHFEVLTKLKLKPKKIVRVHNVNFYFGQEKQRDWTWSGMQLSLKRKWKNESKYRKQFLHTVDSFMFPSGAMRDWALQHTQIDPAKVLQQIFPFTFFQKSSQLEEKKTDHCIIAVTGAVDPKRRDYEHVYDCVKQVLRDSDLKIELLLLGEAKRPEALKLVTQLKTLESERFAVQSYSSLVEEHVYSKEIQRADVLWAPLKLATQFHVSREVYGKTKVSGAVNDAVRFQKKILIPAGYGIESGLEDLLLSYKNKDELVAVLSSAPSKAAIDFSQDSIYSLSQQRSNFSTLLNSD